MPEPAEAPGQSDTGRLEAFSDGVFAIAITLLVLEIKVPTVHGADQAGGLVKALLGLWPSYLGYLISFVTVGIMWANHHAMFVYIARTDRYFLLLNVLLLMGISFLPFPTAVLAEYLPEQVGRNAAVAFYSGTLVVIAVLFNLAWWYAADRGRLLDPKADRKAVRTIFGRYALGPAAYGVSFALAFVNVWASLGVHGLLMGLYLLPERTPE
jgi:uncharacterized membrane protein